MNLNLCRSILRSGIFRNFNKTLCTISEDGGSSVSPPTPSNALESPPAFVPQVYEDKRTTSERPREAWVESLATVEENKVGLITLHPEVFGSVPRLDIIHENFVWQKRYKFVNYNHAKVPVEMRGPGRGYGKKPWPQKGTGRARHGSTRGPQWVKGGTVHGPRRYMTDFYMLPYPKRVKGLAYMLSAKLSQDDLKVVDSLDLPTRESTFLEQLAAERLWGPAVLFVDVNDIMPENITAAADSLPSFNLLPVYGLNVYSMLKHDTLVLTVAAAKKIQEKLVEALYSPELIKKAKY